MGYNIYFSKIDNRELDKLENLKTREDLYAYRESKGYEKDLSLFDILEDSVIFEYGKFNSFPEKLHLMQDVISNHCVPLFDHGTPLGQCYYDDVNNESILIDPDGAFDLIQKAYMDWTRESHDEFRKEPVESKLLDMEYYLSTCKYASVDNLWDNQYEAMIYHLEYIRNNFDWDNNSIIIFGC